MRVPGLTRRPHGSLLALALIALGPAPARSAPAQPPDVARLPLDRSPPVVAATAGRGPAVVALGYTASLIQPDLRDRRRRMAPGPAPEPFGHQLRPGEMFRFDLTFSGNPAGLATARIVSIQDDPRGPPPAGAPTVKVVAHARTSGVITLLATVTDDIESILDAHTGAPLTSTNVIDYKGLRIKYRHRVTVTDFDGRGFLHLDDRKDDEQKTQNRRVPPGTFDPMAAMAWVRSLRLEPGETARAHAMDGTALLRVEIVSRGRKAPKAMPPIASSLGVKAGDIEMIEGVLTRVDPHDEPMEGKRPYTLRAFLTGDERRLPLVMETDMWLGSLRLELVGYDPPHESADAPAPAGG